MADDSVAEEQPEATAKPSAARKLPGATPKPAAEETTADSEGKKKSGAAKESAIRSKGVPTQRLLWWTLPTGGGVAGVGMYSGNPMIALIAIGAALVVGAGALAARVVRGRNGGASGRGPGMSGRLGAPGQGTRPGLLARLRNRGGGAGGRPGLGGRLPGGGPSLPGRGAGAGGRGPGGRGPLGSRAPGAGGPRCRTLPGGTSGSKAAPGNGGRPSRPGGRLNPMNWSRGSGSGSNRAANPSGSRTPGAGANIKPPAGGRTSGMAGAQRSAAGGGRPGGRLNPLNWRGSAGTGTRTSGTGHTPGGARTPATARTTIRPGGPTGPGGGRTSGNGRRRWWPFGGSNTASNAGGPRSPGGVRNPSGSANASNSSGNGRRWRLFRGRSAAHTATSTPPPPQSAPSSQAAAAAPRPRWQRARRWWAGRRNPASATAAGASAGAASSAGSGSSGTTTPAGSGTTQAGSSNTTTPPGTPRPPQQWNAERLDNPMPASAPPRRDPLQISAGAAEVTQEPPVVDELAAKRAERTATDESEAWVAQHPTDDGGFPLYPPPAPIRRTNSPAAAAEGDLREYDAAATQTPAFPATAGASTPKGVPDMSVDTVQYTSKIDNSTPQAYKSSLEQGSADASRTAAVWDERAADARRSAANLDGNPEMAPTREAFLASAAKAEQNAEDHRAMAAGLDAEAAQVKVS